MLVYPRTEHAMQTATSTVSMHFAWGTQPYCGMVRQPVTTTASAVDCPRCREMLASRHPELLEKSTVKSITLTRAEGSADESGKPVTVTTWDAASETLSKWAWTAPGDGGHDKCDFRVEWANGETYEGRFDLEYRHVMGARVEDQIGGFLRYVLKTPGITSAEMVETARRMLATVALG